MNWRKSKKKAEAAAGSEDGGMGCLGALVPQDPRRSVKTTTAQSETTNTTTQNSTIFNDLRNTVTFQSTRQTVTSRQTARITEITSRRTPTADELEEMMRLLHTSKKAEAKAFTSAASSSTSAAGAGKRPTRPPNLPALLPNCRSSTSGNGISAKSTTKFKSTASPVSRFIFSYESALPPDGKAKGKGKGKGDGDGDGDGDIGGAAGTSPRTPTLVKIQQTSVTERNGRSVTSRIEEKRIKFDASKFRLSSPSSPLSNNYGASGGEDNIKRAGAERGVLSSLASSTAKPTPQPSSTTTTTTTTYTSPYNRRTLSVVPSTSNSNTSSSNSSSALPTISTNSTSSQPRGSFRFSRFKSSPSSSTTTSSTGLKSKPIGSATTTSVTATSSASDPITSLAAAKATPPLAASGKAAATLKPGFVYIFNNFIFDDPSTEERVGSAEDVKALRETFEYFRLKVTIIDNAKLDKIRKTVEKIQNKDFSSHACLVIVILSHGSRHEEIAAKDGRYSIDDDILFPILRNRSLDDKPKLFFVQACKGDMESCGYFRDAVPFNAHGSANEILKCYSTFEGFVSYRSEKGSMFIQALCSNLRLFGSTKNIKDIMEVVTKIVKQQSQNKQIPAYTSTLTKPFIFGDYVKGSK